MKIHFQYHDHDREAACTGLSCKTYPLAYITTNELQVTCDRCIRIIGPEGIKAALQREKCSEGSRLPYGVCPKCGHGSNYPESVKIPRSMLWKFPKLCGKCRKETKSVSLPKISGPQRRALVTLAESSKWLGTGSETVRLGYMRINGHVARHLVKLGLAVSRCELIDGRVVSGADLARYLGYWKEKFAITPAGMKAVGWVGRPIAGVLAAVKASS